MGCSVARRAPSAAAAPGRLGCLDDYKRAHYETGLERVGHGKHSYRGTHTWMAETDPYMGAGRTIHVSQARQQSASAGEAKDGTGGMAETGRMAQLISGRVIHNYLCMRMCGHRRTYAQACTREARGADDNSETWIGMTERAVHGAAYGYEGLPWAGVERPAHRRSIIGIRAPQTPWGSGCAGRAPRHTTPQHSSTPLHQAQQRRWDCMLWESIRVGSRHFQSP